MDHLKPVPESASLHARPVVAGLLASAILCVTGCITPCGIGPPEDKSFEPEHVKTYVSVILMYVGGQTEHLALEVPLSKSSPLRWFQHTEEGIANEIEKSAGEMRKRYALIRKTQEQGYVREDERGYVCIEAAAAGLSCDDKNTVQRLVAAENEDRKELYQQLACLAHAPGVSTVENAFAHARLARTNHDAGAVLAPS